MKSFIFIHCFLPKQSKRSLSFTCNSLIKHNNMETVIHLQLAKIRRSFVKFVERRSLFIFFILLGFNDSRMLLKYYSLSNQHGIWKFIPHRAEYIPQSEFYPIERQILPETRIKRAISDPAIGHENLSNDHQPIRARQISLRFAISNIYLTNCM